MQLENEVLRIGFDAETGGFSSVYDKRTGREYVTAPDRALLFRIMAPTDSFRGAHVDGAKPKIAVQGNEATLTFGLEGVDAVATFRLDGDALEGRLRLTNTGAAAIEETMFPWVRGVGPVDGGEFIWPFSFGRRRYGKPFDTDFGGDHHTWNEWTQKVVARYPQHLATAWCDYGNAAGGLGLEGRHTDFSIMDFFVHKVVEKTKEPVRRTLDLATVHPRRVEPGETWETPPVRIVAHEGDWHTVADAHRAWLETWVAKPDRPARFAEAVGWHFYFMKHQDDWVVNTYEDLPKMAQAALDAGCPYLLLFGWQTGGHDNNYLYRYVPNEDWGGAEALRRGIEAARKLGVEIMPFYNGTLANIELPEHKEFGHRWEAMTREGHPYYAGDWARHNFDAPSRNRAMLHHEICPCPEHREYFLETVRRIVSEYGFGNLQLDQISEKMFPCYDRTHGHSTPDRAYVDGLGEILPKTRRTVHESNPEGVIIGEAINDFTGQWCDSFWTWNLMLPFPEPIFYTLPWLMASHEIDALEYDEVNKAFAFKLHLDMKIDGGDAPITKYPAFAGHVKQLAELRRRVRDYYAYADFRDRAKVDVEAAEGVEVKVYENRDSHKVGIVVAETAGAAQEVSFRSAWEAQEARIDSSTGTAAGLDNAADVRVSLEPYEVKVVCIDLKGP